jgi:LAO/AO transport system kinase
MTDGSNQSATEPTAEGDTDLIDDLLAGKHRALARVISKIEDRSPGYRELVSRLHRHTGSAQVIGITGSPGAGKSTLVDKMAKTYRDQGHTVGVIAVDPSSPFTGGAVLGDRIRMASNVGDMDVFFRSMSARGSLGGVSTATTDAVKALDAFGKDRIIVETVGAGQNEVDIVRTADTVAVLVPPSSGDDVQMLKAGILEIGDVFLVNKADLDGANRTMMELEEMVRMREDSPRFDPGHHGAGTQTTINNSEHEEALTEEDWQPPVLEAVAKTGDGVDGFLETLADHHEWLKATGKLEALERERAAEEVRALLRGDVNRLVGDELRNRGGIEADVERIVARESDPYTVADEVLEPLAECVRSRRNE